MEFVALLSIADKLKNLSMAQPVDDSQINPIFLQQLQDALGSEDEEHPVEELDLGVDDQLLVDSLRSIISGENREPQQQQNWNQVLDGNPDPATLEAVQNALKELGGHEVPSTGWKRSITEEDRDRIRQDNRARKRRWRDSHAIRNRDNELRGRITRKANQIFGEQHTPQKHSWIEDEFHRRREGRTRDVDHDGTPLYELFRQSNGTIEASRYASFASNNTHLIHAALNSPSPPAYMLEYKKRPSMRIPMRIRTLEAKSLGAPPRIELLAKKYVPEKPSRKLGELGEKLGLTPLPKSIIARFGLPNAPEDLRKLGPMPPLPKSIIEHQKREKERKEKEEKEKIEREKREAAAAAAAQSKAQQDTTVGGGLPDIPAAPNGIPVVPTTVPQAPAPEIPTIDTSLPMPEIPSLGPTVPVTPAVDPHTHTETGTPSSIPSHAPSHLPSHSGTPLPDKGDIGEPGSPFPDLGNIDEMLGSALGALQGDDADILDPSQAIKELQMALEQQGLFEHE